MPSSANLIWLVSFAGGPVQYAKLDEVKLTRLILNDSTGRKREIVFDLEHLDKLEQSSLALYPGDTIFIDHASQAPKLQIWDLGTHPAKSTRRMVGTDIEAGSNDHDFVTLGIPR